MKAQAIAWGCFVLGLLAVLGLVIWYIWLAFSYTFNAIGAAGPDAKAISAALLLGCAIIGLRSSK